MWSKQNNNHLKSERNRFDTFTSWCGLDECEKIKLARFGFYFKQPPNIVKCIFCNLEMSHNPSDDNSLKEHLRWSPACPFLNHQPTDNIPLDPDLIEQKLATIAKHASSFYKPIQIRGNSCPESVQLDSEKIREIRREDYNRLSQRIKSFKNWPNTDKSNTNILCDAGFFYSGQHDQIRCFSCGGELKRHTECYDPWELHALWYENCNYLRNSKPITFIVNVKNKYQNEIL